jgi:hypothetical protein
LFERAHHQRIAVLLESLDAELLAQKACLFGGGTAIALRFGEYRESVDVDFLTSDVAGYRDLRQLLTGPQGLRAILRPGAAVQAVRELRADQYGIRTLLRVAEAEIKFEIVLEARIQLELPTQADRICGVATLTALDMNASKLLANSDRWADDSVFSRDLIDLAMMQPKRALLKRAIAKAQAAYGDSIEADLAKAVAHLLGREGRLERCMDAMRIHEPKAVLWQRIRALVATKAKP